MSNDAHKQISVIAIILIMPVILCEIDTKDETFISRIREDKTIPNGLNMWIVSDNLLRGAALNSVEIAETLIKNNFYGK